MTEQGLTPAERHCQIARTVCGTDLVTLSVLVEQIGSMSKILCAVAESHEGWLGYKGEFKNELADLVYHLSVLAMRHGTTIKELVDLGKERYCERQNK